MNQSLSKIISSIFNPLIMPSLLFIILLVFSPIILAPFTTWYFIVVIFITTFAIPFISIYFLFMSGSLKSLKMEEKNERILPFLFTGIFYATICYMFIYQFKVNGTVSLILASSTLTIFFIAFVTIFWKISSHSAGVMSVLGFLTAFNMRIPGQELFLPILILLSLAGLVLSSRLSLNQHNPQQVLAGSLVGFLINFLAVILFI